MINDHSLRAVAAEQFNDHFGKPLYDTYCFSQIPQTVYSLLTGDGPIGLPADVLGDLPRRFDKVILLFIDAFGWRFFERYADKYPFLKRFVDQGIVSKLTSQFPSTTTAHTATIHSGRTVGETGIYEWFYYEPLVDRIIAPLLFSFAGDKGRDTLRQTRIAPEMFFALQPTAYQRLDRHGVRSYAFHHQDYAHSAFTELALAGSRNMSFKTISEALVSLADMVVAEKERAYFYLYFDGIDTIGHLYGPGSRQFEAEIDTFFSAIERLLHGNLAGKLHNALLLITADHGQVAVSPDATIYLNHLAPSIEPFIKTNQRGELLVPAGSPRDMFLYIKEEWLDEAQELLTRQLAGHAEVYNTQHLIEQRMFGPGQPSETFSKRVGNLVILPYDNETVWWYEKGRFEQRLSGHHGGLTHAEMETLLLALPYS